MIEWKSVKEDGLPIERPNKVSRILTYSPSYEGISEEMTYRIMNIQFVSICKEATHYKYLD
jgi:hypothetical protein